MAPNQHSPFYYMLQSRKAWATLIGLILMVITAVINRQAIDPNTLVNGIMALVGIYVGSIAIEDGMTARAAATQATTTVSTPGTSDVQVTAPPDVSAAPVITRLQPMGDDTGAPQPVVTHTGLN